MSMVITCESCSSRFRFDVGLLKGAKGAIVKCPRCSERILVRNPAAPRVMPPVVSPSMPRDTPPIDQRISPPVLLPPPVYPPTLPLPAQAAAVDTKTPPIQGEGQGGMIWLVPPERPVAGTDLSAMIMPSPGHTLPVESTVFPAADPASVSPEIPGRMALRLEDLFIHPSAVEGDRIPGGGDYGPMVSRPPGPGWKPPPRRPLYRRPLFLAAAISILLVAGGTFYFVDGNSGRKSTDSVIPSRARSTPENSVFDVVNVKGFLIRKPSGEPFYVVKGTVTNIGKALSSGIRIEATLLGKDNQAIVRNGSFAGNVIDESLIPHMNRVRIEGFLGMQHGEGDVNRDIPSGKTLPFMVVFFDPQEEVASFRVEAIDAGEADRIVSPDGKALGTEASNQHPIRLN